MKGYICAILLLICGMAHCFQPSFYRARIATCIFEGKVIFEGDHTVKPCGQITCDQNGDVTFTGCPDLNCPPEQKLVSTRVRYGAYELDFPHCCVYPICES